MAPSQFTGMRLGGMQTLAPQRGGLRLADGPLLVGHLRVTVTTDGHAQIKINSLGPAHSRGGNPVGVVHLGGDERAPTQP